MRASFITYFLEIAEEEYAKHDELVSVFRDETGKYDHELIGPFLDEAIALERVYIKVIIFLTSYLEAYIWDAAATYLGEKHAKQIDKLGIMDKWDIIPRFVLGKDLEIKNHIRAKLHELIKERNFLVHHKSIEVSSFINMESPKPLPKELSDFWERVNLKQFFEMSKMLTTQFEAAIANNKVKPFHPRQPLS